MKTSLMLLATTSMFVVVGCEEQTEEPMVAANPPKPAAPVLQTIVINGRLNVKTPEGFTGFVEVAGEITYQMVRSEVALWKDPILVYEIVFFNLNAYKAFLLDQVTKYGEIKLTSATFVLTQVEVNLYKYYNLAKGFLDEFSIRSDLPDFSNISAGYGLFGAMRDDSVVVDLH